jgi:chromosome segregation ATPase
VAMSKFDDKIAEMKVERNRIKGELTSINDTLKKIDDEIKPILKQKKQLDDLLKTKTDGKQPQLNKLKALQDKLETLEEAEHKLAAKKILASRLLDRGYPIDVIYEANDKDLAKLQNELDDLAGSESKLKAQEERLQGLIATIKKDPQERKEFEISKKIKNIKKTIVANSQQTDAVSDDDNSEDRVAVAVEDKKTKRINFKGWKTN